MKNKFFFLSALSILISPPFFAADQAKTDKRYTPDYIKGKVEFTGHGFYDCLRRLGMNEKDVLNAKGQRWLSVGEGKSDFIAEISKRGIDGQALDAVIKNPHAPERSHIGLAQALPFKEGEFDKVVSIWLMDHFFSPKVFNDPEGGKKALNEMLRVVKVNGEIRINPVEQSQVFAILDALKTEGKIKYAVLPYYQGAFSTHDKQRLFEITPVPDTTGSVTITRLK